MLAIGLVLALGVALAPSAASSGSLMLIAVDASSGRVLPDASVSYVYLVNEYWDPPTSPRMAPRTLKAGDYQVSVVAPGYKETSVRISSSVLNSRIPFVIRLEKATPSSP